VTAAGENLDSLRALISRNERRRVRKEETGSPMSRQGSQPMSRDSFRLEDGA